MLLSSCLLRVLVLDMAARRLQFVRLEIVHEQELPEEHAHTGP